MYIAKRASGLKDVFLQWHAMSEIQEDRGDIYIYLCKKYVIV